MVRAWVERNKLGAEGLRTRVWKPLPRAVVVKIEVRSEFDWLDPMEVVAGASEVDQLLDRPIPGHLIPALLRGPQVPDSPY
ncbi:MAG: hypothetical protein AB7W28_00670 [Armatimonadota bacterium]